MDELNNRVKKKIDEGLSPEGGIIIVPKTKGIGEGEDLINEIRVYVDLRGYSSSVNDRRDEVCIDYKINPFLQRWGGHQNA
jgi:hypothetical protein|tara:strand:+ start:411 stop:653 length:243 start_codon:yes stop_codon:yes gene_type:complete